jgi:hypothetical protein
LVDKEIPKRFSAVAPPPELSPITDDRYPPAPPPPASESVSLQQPEPPPPPPAITRYSIGIRDEEGTKLKFPVPPVIVVTL